MIHVATVPEPLLGEELLVLKLAGIAIWSGIEEDARVKFEIYVPPVRTRRPHQILGHREDGAAVRICWDMGGWGNTNRL